MLLGISHVLIPVKKLAGLGQTVKAEHRTQMPYWLSCQALTLQESTKKACTVVVLRSDVLMFLAHCFVYFQRGKLSHVGSGAVKRPTNSICKRN